MLQLLKLDIFYCKVFYLGEMSFKLYIQQFNICDIINGAINYKLRRLKNSKFQSKRKH